MINPDDMHLGQGEESIHDTAKVLTQYADIVMLRTTSHKKAIEFSKHLGIPLINGLTDSNITNANGIRKARPTLKADNNRQKAIVTRLGVSPFLGLDLGTSYYTGKIDSNGEKKLDMMGLDAFYKTGALEFVGEYAQNTIDKLSDTAPEKMDGFYVETRYHLTGDWLKNSPFGEGFRNPVITLFARYGQVDTNKDVKDVNDLTQTTVGFNYRPVETVAYKFEYEMNEEAVNKVENDTFWASVSIGF